MTITPSRNVKLTLRIDEPRLLNRQQPILFTTGYLGGGITPQIARQTGLGKVASFDDMVRRVGLLVFDIRLNPWSVAPCWRKAEMQERLGERYHHVRDLGNLNYSKKGNITIANLERGIQTVLQMCAASDGLFPLLLCGCAEYEECHRCVVGHAFADRAREWCEITGWADPQKVGRGGTPQTSGLTGGKSGDVLGIDLTSEWAGKGTARA